MVAQKLKNNKIAISSGSNARKDALQTIEDLRVGEFFRLSRAARNWEKSLNDKRDIMFTTYENEHSKVCKEFDTIYQRRQLWAELLAKRVEEDAKKVDETVNHLNETVSTSNPKEKISYKSSTVGTSKLIRIPGKQIIKITRRKGSNDTLNRPNCVCIDNLLREEFFTDVKKTFYFKNYKVYEIMCNEEDKEVFEKWDKKVTEIYNLGLSKKENINQKE